MSVRRKAHTTPPGPLHEAGPQERLARFDELAAPDLDSLERDPRLGSQLAFLREVDELLQKSLPPEAPCPPAADLYDYAGGPGATPLEGPRRRRLLEHLDVCVVCAEQVQSLSLAAPPPALLDESAVGRPLREPTALRIARWLPMAAAAGLLAMAFFVFKSPGVQAMEWPGQPLLRGADHSGPQFPRGPVLETGSASALPFEMNAVEGATLYRAVVARHAGGAFAEGEEILRLEGGTPTLVAGEALTAGSYTWDAWAVVDGLERHLGARDFRVLSEAELGDAERSAAADALQGVARVRALHTAGFWTDARRAARALPASTERDVYLGAVPGR